MRGRPTVARRPPCSPRSPVHGPLGGCSRRPAPGPEIHDQSQLAQLIALGHTAAVLFASSRSWLWGAHAAVPLTDAPHVTTVLAWPPHSRSLAVAGLVRTATAL